MFLQRFFQLSICVLLAVGLSAGCGKKEGKLSLTGTVKYKGVPVTGGSVSLIPSDPKAGTGQARIRGDGTFQMVPPSTGEMKVVVETESAPRRSVNAAYANPDPEFVKKHGKPEIPVNPKEEKYVKIPFKYAKQETTDLTINIKPGSNEVNLDLKD